MAYDERLADRIRSALRGRDDVREQKMFGGVAFMVAGKMAVGVIHDDLMVRVGADGFEDALAKPHVRPMDFSGWPAKGMVYVAPAGVATDDQLAGWVDRAVQTVVQAPSRR